MTERDSVWSADSTNDTYPTRASRRRQSLLEGDPGARWEPLSADEENDGTPAAYGPEAAPDYAPSIAARTTGTVPNGTVPYEPEPFESGLSDTQVFEADLSDTRAFEPHLSNAGPIETDSADAGALESRPTDTDLPAAEPGESRPFEYGRPPRGASGSEPVAELPPPPAEPPATRQRASAARTGRRSFLTPDTAVVPAETGLRGALTRIGVRIPPSAAELTVRAHTRAVSQHWPGPRTIAVVNGKGGANKTPTTVMLAAVFARNGGGPVLAWDNNETRGTLGWRTEQGPHEATVLDLLPQTGALLAPSAQSALLARYVHHQTEDKYDVLRSKPDVLASEQKVTSRDFDALHEVASKYFRLNVVDSGNDETAERWLRMLHHTHQLVIATTTLEEHAEAGALLLEALRARGGDYEQLSRNAVVIVSQSDKNGTAAQAQAIAAGFTELARSAVTIPFDPALLKGRIRYGSLRPATQRAWLAAAAAVAEGL
ncbi:ATPase [Arthrobacter sp. MSA 4-2]|uniref:ATPase n=1 Tax=Arthrobacter sp. MSA 4-2 TaxID=2794349 RepID=UPI0018E89321|nr:ATPase [Arthrobacter sp. MSA 4-2]MBJ2120401.1 ATPase [Arthrobacter sp. MSA 4-2]